MIWYAAFAIGALCGCFVTPSIEGVARVWIPLLSLVWLTNGFRLDFSLIAKYYKSSWLYSLVATGLKVSFLFMLFSHGSGAYMATALFDCKSIPFFSSNPYIPPYVKHSLLLSQSISAVLFTCVLFFFVENPFLLGCILTGAFLTGIAFGRMCKTYDISAVLFVIPILFFAFPIEWAIPFLSATIAMAIGITPQKRYCRAFFTRIGVVQKYGYGVYYALLGMIAAAYGSDLYPAISQTLVYGAIFLLLGFLSWKNSGFRVETALLHSLPLQGISGGSVLLFAYSEAFSHGFCSIIILQILSALITPAFLKWYGDRFTGRDRYSRLLEHAPVIGLAI